MKDAKNWIIFFLLATLVLGWWFWPDPVPATVKQQIAPHQKAIERKQVTIDSLMAANRTLRKQASKNSAQRIVERRAYKRRETARQFSYDSARSEAKRFYDSIPQVRAAIDGAENLLTLKQQRIDTLENDLRIAELVQRDLGVQMEDQFKAFTELVMHKDAVIEIQDKALRKQKRKDLRNKIIGGVAIGVALWVGSQM